MKTIGLIGGMSWESSNEYYRLINETVQEKLGGLHSAQIVMYSFNFERIKQLQQRGEWDEATKLMIDAAQKLERAGADIILICTNTMHKMANEVQANIQVPLLHIADTTAKVIKAQELRKIGLLGTRFTMEHDFYKGRLTSKHGVEVLIPNSAERQIIHDVIFDELCQGKIKQSSKERYIEIMDHLIANGAEGIILGCTEIFLLVNQDDSSVPILDTTRIHALAAVEYAISE